MVETLLNQITTPEVSDSVLAPYKIKSTCTGSYDIFFVVKDGDHYATAQFETREEAEAERNRLNSKHGLDSIGV